MTKLVLLVICLGALSPDLVSSGGAGWGRISIEAKRETVCTITEGEINDCKSEFLDQFVEGQSDPDCREILWTTVESCTVSTCAKRMPGCIVDCLRQPVCGNEQFGSASAVDNVLSQPGVSECLDACLALPVPN